MAMIRRADSHEVARDAVVLNLGDLMAHGETLKRAAKDKAEAMLTSARAERDRLVAGAAIEGRAQGLAKGLDEGRAKGLSEGRTQAATEHRAALDALEKSWTEALSAFESQRDGLLIEAKQDVLRLALLIAGRVTHRVVRAEAGVVNDQLAAVLSLISRPTRLVIAVHPDDLACAGEALPGLLQRFRNAAHAEIVADPSLALGSCIARAEGGAEIDASIDTQLERIAAALVPAPAPPSLSLAGTPGDPPDSEAA